MCAFIGAQAQVDVKKTNGRNPLVELAQSIDILAPPSALDQLRGERVADDWQDDPRLAPRVPADPESGVEAANSPGSYEAFAAMFGAQRPPGPPPGGDEG